MRLVTNLVLSAAARAWSFVRAATAAIVAIGLMGCQPTVTPTPVPNAITGQNPGDVKYYPSDEPVKLGIQRFYEGNYRLAQQYFQNAVEKTPKTRPPGSDWRRATIDWGDSILPIAAMRLRPNWWVTPRIILNNEGYSYMLRGDLRKARAKFDAALRLDPATRRRSTISLCSIKVRNSSSARRTGSRAGASIAFSERAIERPQADFPQCKGQRIKCKRCFDPAFLFRV